MTVRPKALRPGSTLGIAAPSSAVEPELLDLGVAELRAMGFGVVVPEGVLAKARFTAGSPDRRAAELHALLEDPRIDGILCARGGAGAASLLPLLDAGRFRRHPKALVGYSDVTALHLFLGRLGVVSFHGPMAARGIADAAYDRAAFLGSLSGDALAASDDLVPVRAGAAEGVLRGGNLAVLSAAAGTPWALPVDEGGTLLLIEEVNERPYRLDRMLVQLRLSGALARVKGIVFGEMEGCAVEAGLGYDLEDVILDALAGLDVPVAMGLRAGHSGSPCLTLPLGVRARITCGDSARFETLEAGVA